MLRILTTGALASVLIACGSDNGVPDYVPQSGGGAGANNTGTAAPGAPSPQDAADGGTSDGSPTAAEGGTEPGMADGDSMAGDDSSAPDAGSPDPAPTPNDGGKPVADAGTKPDKPPVEPPSLVEGCQGQWLREGIPTDLAAPGPWPVGAVTTNLGGITTEVWYPAKIGSDAGAKQIVYDIREYLPPENQGSIPDENSPAQPCDCYRELPLDTEAGPFPVVVFVHGTAGFRTTNLENAVHWASRGFVVVASDHPGISLQAQLLQLGGGNGGTTDQAGDARRVLEDLQSPTGPVAFLDGHLDWQRVGAMGHSAGANAVTSLGDVADVIIPYAGGGAISADRVQSVLYTTGDTDSVVAPSSAGYDGSDTPIRRLIYIARGGHLVGGSLCTLRDPSDPSKSLVDIVDDHDALGPVGTQLALLFFPGLFDGCNELPTDDDPFINEQRSIEILSYMSAGQLEETLHCSSTAGAELAKIGERYGDDISRYEETVP